MKAIFNILAVFALIAVFALTASLVILRTAGYSYNLKKKTIEKAGILVVKSKPTDAAITLNGRDLDKTTPLRIRSLPPGTYEVAIKKQGYRVWSGTVPVESGRAAYVERVRLYPDATPASVATGTIRAAALSANRERVAWISETKKTFEIIVSRAKNPSPAAVASFPRTVQDMTPELTWSPEAEHLLFTRRAASPGEAGAHAIVYLLPPSGPAVEVDDILKKPASSVRWSPENPALLEAAVGKQIFLIDPIGRRVIKTDVPPRSAEEYAHLGPQRGDWLPSIRSPRGDIGISYRDAAVSFPPLFARGYAWAPDPTDERLLVWNETEWWISYPIRDDKSARINSELIRRIGAGIDAVTWAADGASVYFATGGTVAALDLTDYGFGRRTTELARFDRIAHLFAPRDDQALFIIGSKDGLDGVWRLPLE